MFRRWSLISIRSDGHRRLRGLGFVGGVGAASLWRWDLRLGDWCGCRAFLRMLLLLWGRAGLLAWRFALLLALLGSLLPDALRFERELNPQMIVVH